MEAMDGPKKKLETLLDELSRANQLPRLKTAAHDVDRIIDLLSEAREQIAGSRVLRSPQPQMVEDHSANVCPMALQPWTHIRPA
jgi:hypothetical protein